MTQGGCAGGKGRNRSASAVPGDEGVENKNGRRSDGHLGEPELRPTGSAHWVALGDYSSFFFFVVVVVVAAASVVPPLAPMV